MVVYMHSCVYVVYVKLTKSFLGFNFLGFYFHSFRVNIVDNCLIFPDPYES